MTYPKKMEQKIDLIFDEYGYSMDDFIEGPSGTITIYASPENDDFGKLQRQRKT